MTLFLNDTVIHVCFLGISSEQLNLGSSYSIVIIQLNFVKIKLSVCYDQRSSMRDYLSGIKSSLKLLLDDRNMIFKR